MNNQTNVVVDQITVAGIAGLGTIVVVQLVSLPQLDTALWIAVYCFAVAIPCAAGAYIIRAVDSLFESTIHRWYEDALGIPALGVGFLGIAAVFWHFSWFASLVFIAISIAAVYAFDAYHNALREADRQASKDDTEDK